MYIKIDEIEEIKARLFHIENRNNKNKKIQFSRIREIISNVEKRYGKLKERQWDYVKEQRKFNKDYARGKGVKSVKIKRASDAPLESEV